MKFLHEIRIQEKSSTDWRGFVICCDSKNNKWELRTSGKESPALAATEAYNRFNEDEQYWDIYGYII